MRIVPDVHEPEFSLPGGRYYETQTVTISCETPGAHIYYTTDGSEPSATNGTLYDGGSITVDETMTLKAIAVYGGVSSAVIPVTYTIQPLGGNDYILVESTNDITANDEYVLVRTDNNSTDYAMATYNTKNYYNTSTGGFVGNG